VAEAAVIPEAMLETEATMPGETIQPMEAVSRRDPRDGSYREAVAAMEEGAAGAAADAWTSLGAGGDREDEKSGNKA